MRTIAVGLLVAVVLTGCAPAPAPVPEPTSTIESGRYEVRLTGFATTSESPYSLLLSPFPLTDDRTCLDMFAFDLGDPSMNGDGPFPVGDFADWYYDPTFFDGAALGQYIEADAAANDCLRTVVARAPFIWDFPDLRPGLRVVDSGPAVGAMGTVTLDNGEPASYVVVADDIMGEIAHRFGISTDDLLYLNPARTSPSDDVAYVDEVLNLGRASR